MEQKKILWVLLSVTLFLFIVSIAGVVWFYPGRIAVAGDGDTDTFENQDKAVMDLDPVELLRNGEGFLGLLDNDPEENIEEGFSIVYGETEGEEPVLDLVAEDQPEKIIEDTTFAVTSPVVNKKVVTTSTSTVAAPAPKKINVLDYWIQAGSFSSRSGAEGASNTLSDKGFSNLITIKTINDDDYFRVRMGPYASKAEAEKFLGWIKEIDSYEKSYISQVQKTVN